MFGLKTKIAAVALLVSITACSLIWIHISNLNEDLAQLQDKAQAQSLIIDSYEQNMAKLREKQEKERKIQESNRVARGEVFKSQNEEILTLKEALDEANNACLNAPLPEPILNGLRTRETTN